MGLSAIRAQLLEFKAPNQSKAVGARYPTPHRTFQVPDILGCYLALAAKKSSIHIEITQQSTRWRRYLFAIGVPPFCAIRWEGWRSSYELEVADRGPLSDGGVTGLWACRKCQSY